MSGLYFFHTRIEYRLHNLFVIGSNFFIYLIRAQNKNKISATKINKRPI